MGFQYWLPDHLIHPELDTVWMEDRTACRALESAVVGEAPLVSSTTTLEADQGCCGCRGFGPDINTRQAVFRA